MNTQEVSSALADRARIIRLNLYSGQGAFRRGGGGRGGGEGAREGYLSFPSCTSSRTQIGTEGRAVSPGISIPPFARLPPRRTCQRTSIHAGTHAPVVCLRRRAGTPERATMPLPPPSAPTLQLTRDHAWWTLLVCSPQCWFMFRELPASWCRRLGGTADGAAPRCPEERL